MCGLNPKLIKEIEDNNDIKVIEKFVVDTIDNYLANETPEGFTVDDNSYWEWVNIGNKIERHPGETGLAIQAGFDLICNGEIEE